MDILIPLHIIGNGISIKIYDKAFEKKAVQLGYAKTDTSKESLFLHLDRGVLV